MPYKHIAAHLRKTELACRLHYHQLCHGSGRRRRAPSCSSLSSDHSPVMTTSTLAPFGARSLSPPNGLGGYATPPYTNDLHLPSIRGSESPPRLPAILPKPMSIPLPQPDGSQPGLFPGGYALLPPVTLQPGQAHHANNLPLRLDCSNVPPPSTAASTPAHVNLNRLHAVYAAHRDSFWTAIAKEYGGDVSPMVLEQAWRSGRCCHQQMGGPMTPAASPESASATSGRIVNLDKARIASILSFDGDERAPVVEIR